MTETQMTYQIETVIELIESTIGDWGGADWTHELTLRRGAPWVLPWRDARSCDHVVRETEDSDATMCSGEDWCSTCHRATAAKVPRTIAPQCGAKGTKWQEVRP